MTDRLRLPDERGGWWHAYVCASHGVELEHDELLSGSFPAGGARCPYGCRHDSADLRGAWAALAHQACARAIRELASTDPDECVLALVEYAERYERLTVTGEHEGAQAWMLRGRLFHQALSEAIWAVSIGNAVWDLTEQDVRTPGQVRAMLDALAVNARTAREQLATDGKFSSNYTAWLLAAEAVTSRAVECQPCDGWLADLEAHVRTAVHDDGWEWEASTYYHGFVLRAYLLALRGVQLSTVSPDVRTKLTAMVSVLNDILTPGGTRPELHDGPYARSATEPEWRELAELSGPLMDSARTEHRSFGVTRVFPDTGLVVVRGGGVHAMLDAGPHGGPHGHRDKLSLYLYGERAAWQPDPGQVPYASPLRAHYASTSTHPGFMVDETEQAECSGRIVHSDEHSVTVACSDAYEGVHATRQLVGTAECLLDVLTVTADRPRRIAVLLRPGAEFEAHATPDGLMRTYWRADGETLLGWHLASEPGEFAVRPGLGLPDDPQRSRAMADWMAEADRIRFVSLYTAKEVDDS